MVDRCPRGLLAPAWTGGGNYHAAKVVFVEGPYAGMTVAEVARALRTRQEAVRDMALKGICPSKMRRG